MCPTLFQIPWLRIPAQSFGVCLAVGFLVAILAARTDATRLHLLRGLVTRVLLVSAIPGVLGCRLFYVIHFWGADFASARNPLGAAADLRSGGRELYGGIILCVVFVVMYLRYKRVQLLAHLDVLSSAGLLIYAFGRVGCFLGGCCWGTVCTEPNGQPSIPWAVTFPCGSPAFVQQWKTGLLESTVAAGVPDARTASLCNCALPEMARLRSLPVHPAQLYASLSALLLYAFSRGARRITRKPGAVFALLLVLSPIARILLDGYRADCPPDAFGVSIHTIVSAALAALGLIVAVWLVVGPARTRRVEVSQALTT
jgi:phosphatidylglycerol:prolipoprotein diacylglycerol transferase